MVLVSRIQPVHFVMRVFLFSDVNLNLQFPWEHTVATTVQHKWTAMNRFVSASESAAAVDTRVSWLVTTPPAAPSPQNSFLFSVWFSVSRTPAQETCPEKITANINFFYSCGCGLILEVFALWQNSVWLSCRLWFLKQINCLLRYKHSCQPTTGEKQTQNRKNI